MPRITNGSRAFIWSSRSVGQRSSGCPARRAPRGSGSWADRRGALGGGQLAALDLAQEEAGHLGGRSAGVEVQRRRQAVQRVVLRQRTQRAEDVRRGRLGGQGRGRRPEQDAAG